MSKELVGTWLESYMFGGLDDCVERAQSVSDWLAGHDNFKSHSRHIPRDEAEKRRLVVYRIESDEALQDLALSVFHATTHTFAGSPAVKIVESHTGRAFVKQHVVQSMPAVQLGLVPSGSEVVVPPDS